MHNVPLDPHPGVIGAVDPRNDVRSQHDFAARPAAAPRCAGDHPALGHRRNDKGRREQRREHEKGKEQQVGRHRKGAVSAIAIIDGDHRHNDQYTCPIHICIYTLNIKMVCTCIH
jgi:hypothetical protein